MGQFYIGDSKQRAGQLSTGVDNLNLLRGPRAGAGAHNEQPGPRRNRGSADSVVRSVKSRSEVLWLAPHVIASTVARATNANWIEHRRIRRRKKRAQRRRFIRPCAPKPLAT
jgi:hypothetical protein